MNLHKLFQSVVILMMVTFLLMPLYGCSKHKLVSKYNIEKSALTSRESVGKLTLALDDPEPNVRARAIAYLSKMGTYAHEAMPKMMQLAENDPDERVRSRALIAIASIHRNKNETIQYLEDYINNSESQRLKTQADKAIAIAMRSSSSYGVVEIKQNPTKDLAVIDLKPEFQYNDGYNQNSRSVARFGILPLHINIKNLSSSTISINPEDITLFARNTEDNPLKRFSAEEVARKMEYSMKRAVTKAVLLGPFSIASPFRAGRANRIIAQNTKEAAFKKMKIEPFEQENGYLFFKLPKNTRNLVGYKIHIKLSDLGNNDIYGVTYIFGDTCQVLKTTGQPLTNRKEGTGEYDIEMKLVTLKKLFDKGLISEEEYTEKRAFIISAY